MKIKESWPANSLTHSVSLLLAPPACMCLLPYSLTETMSTPSLSPPPSRPHALSLTQQARGGNELTQAASTNSSIQTLHLGTPKVGSLASLPPASLISGVW